MRLIRTATFLFAGLALPAGLTASCDGTDVWLVDVLGTHCYGWRCADVSVEKYH